MCAGVGDGALARGWARVSVRVSVRVRFRVRVETTCIGKFPATCKKNLFKVGLEVSVSVRVRVKVGVSVSVRVRVREGTCRSIKVGK